MLSVPSKSAPSESTFYNASVVMNGHRESFTSLNLEAQVCPTSGLKELL